MERKGPMPLQYPGLEAVCQTKATGQRLLLATKSWDRCQEVMEEIMECVFL
jgi:hypothetical protein